MKISEEIFRLVPPCDLCESDRFEVRFQFIPEESGACNVDFYLDTEKPENCFFWQTVQLTARKAVLVKSL